MKRLLALVLLLLATTAAPARNIVEINRVVAVVNDDVVTAGELDERTRFVAGQLQKKGTPMPDREVLTRQVLERLILERIQLQLAQNVGLRVEDEAVNQVVNNIARENKMTLDQFRDVLAKDGMNYADFRRDIRNEILITRLRARQVTNRVTVTPQEIDYFLAASGQHLNQEYRLSHILIAVPEAASPEQVQAARAEAGQVLARLHTGANFSQLAISHSDGQQALEGGDLGWRRGAQLPSLFVDVVKDMKEGQISDLIRSPGGFHIIQLTGLRGEDKHVIRQTHARHILIRPNELVSDADARQRLERLRQRILNGESFAELARAHSDDKGSGSQGGDLGWASPGQMVPEFDKAMNETPLQQVSEPFRSQFGWHIVQPLERRDHDNTDEIRRSRAAEALRQRKVDEDTDAWLRQIRDEAYVEYRLEG
jgi:peptidyl-prolyl cis-trans isomerase SurA